MARTLIPAAACLIIRHGSHVLLQKRSDKVESWPNFWAFPGGKVDDGEMMRHAALREATEEIGIIAHPEHIEAETIVMFQTIQGTKIVYFGLVEQYENAPAIIEPDLASDLAWFPITELPHPMVPHHITGLSAILARVGYSEVDMVDSSL